MLLILVQMTVGNETFVGNGKRQNNISEVIEGKCLSFRRGMRKQFPNLF